METHMAMQMDHEDVVVSRVSCAAYAMSREGRLKIFAPSTFKDNDEESILPAHQLAIEGLIRSLLEEAAGTLSSHLDPP